MADKQNCWEYMGCGREQGGGNAGGKEACPAAASEVLDGINFGRNGGRICWAVAGTFCGGTVQGAFAEKKQSCRDCGFFKQVREEEMNARLCLDGYDVFAASHIGLVRDANEDRYMVRQFPDRSLLFGVADGLGGHAGGDYAAEILRTKLAQMGPVQEGREQEILARLAVDTDRVILETAGEKPELEGMGTTMLAVLLRGATAHYVHVGDSRFSILRSGRLLQVTREQNLARFLVEEGQLKKEEVPEHYSRNVLDQALGSAMEVPETGAVKICANDLLLLSTDGLHSQISEETMASVLATELDVETKVKLLVRTALDAGGNDNITIVGVQLLA